MCQSTWVTLKRISTTYSVLELLTYVFEVNDSGYFDQIEQLKAGLKSIKLVDFPGENFINCCLKIDY